MTMPANKKKESANSRTEIPTKPSHYSGNGQAFEEDVFEDECYQVSEAVITQTRIAMDWTDGGELFHVSATPTDGGATYEGHFGQTKPDPTCKMQIRRFTSRDGTELLLVKWHRGDTGNAGLDIIELSKNKK
jgi:hypothetical protein